jgi:protoporphyrinogen oxidase
MEYKKNKKYLILGAGIAGLGAAFKCNELGYSHVVLEKSGTYGGLLDSFKIKGFTFDRFVHLSFASDERVKKIFLDSAKKVLNHIPNPYNIYKELWIKHPAQNNLYPLSESEKNLIISDFLQRPKEVQNIQNYEDWLRCQYGNYFAENFPMAYTRKYWMHEAKDLRTEWVGSRLYQPSVEEVIIGSKTSDTPVTYYAKEMKYPEYGGYKSFIKNLANNSNIIYNETVIEIDVNLKTVTTSSGNEYEYDRLISSIPLPEMVKIIKNLPSEIVEAGTQLKATSGYHISVGLKGNNIPPYLWWYIYDENILSARVYSPSIKSANNAPKGCSSLQMEIYCKEGQYSEEQLIEGSIQKLIDLNIIKKEDIIFTNIGFEKYANVIFTEPIYRCRDIVKSYLRSNEIVPIGRFGEWDYLWSDQSLLSGMNSIDDVK